VSSQAVVLQNRECARSLEHVALLRIYVLDMTTRNPCHFSNCWDMKKKTNASCCALC
jgi:hypothetical protein